MHLIQVDVQTPHELDAQLVGLSMKRAIVGDRSHKAVFANKVATSNKTSESIEEYALSIRTRQSRPSDQGFAVRGAQLPSPSWKLTQREISRSRESTKSIRTIRSQDTSESRELPRSPTLPQSLKSLKLLSENLRLPPTIKLTPVNSSDPMCLQCLVDSRDIAFFNFCAGTR